MPRRFAPRNDRGGGMSLRATFLPPRTRPSFSMSLRTSAHTCGNPRPAGILYKLAAVSANSLRLTDLPKVLLFVLCSRRGCGLSRRFAPRNGSGETSLPPQTRHRFLHVIANQCAHWCGNPHPRRETWQVGSCSGEFVATCAFVQNTPKKTGTPNGVPASVMD